MLVLSGRQRRHSIVLCTCAHLLSPNQLLCYPIQHVSSSRRTFSATEGPSEQFLACTRKWSSPQPVRTHLASASSRAAVMSACVSFQRDRKRLGESAACPLSLTHRHPRRVASCILIPSPVKTCEGCLFRCLTIASVTIRTATNNYVTCSPPGAWRALPCAHDPVRSGAR